ncbi:hypothetical protein IWW36_003725 [Coemansia brasiliensis]|uniref:Uncharacterized protein n=1 Tax=Coemansia brasiliensis TaxID=2650707 RepID=A0A9W8LY98_9FUNG|nr:hypothetical protein IWW36_003725 [Coemansia brasiliensis]
MVILGLIYLSIYAAAVAMGLDTEQDHDSAKQLSSKLKLMKFMQRSEDRARAETERKIEQKRVDESHWRAIYPDEVFSESDSPRVRVLYEPSYLKMPAGDTAVRSDGSCGNGDDNDVALGRRSFKSFNAKVEQSNVDVEMRQRDERTEQFEKSIGVDEKEMAQALSKNAPLSLRQKNSQLKRKRK